MGTGRRDAAARSPIHNTRRFLAGPIELEGQLMQAGETVLLVLAAAAMAQPEAHWTFGAQGHACPGATRRAAMRPARWSICCGPASTTPPWGRAFATAPAQCPHSPI
ncbi:hypothetical protein WJ969_29535 [Achromobacter xylosoxidans]